MLFPLLAPHVKRYIYYLPIPTSTARVGGRWIPPPILLQYEGGEGSGAYANDARQGRKEGGWTQKGSRRRIQSVTIRAAPEQAAFIATRQSLRKNECAHYTTTY